jgi:hypothetical protein
MKVNCSIIIWFVHLFNRRFWYLIDSSTHVRLSASLPLEQMKCLPVLQVTSQITTGSDLCISLSTLHKIVKNYYFHPFHVYAWTILASTGWIFTKSYVWACVNNLEKIQVWLKSKKNNRYFTWKLNAHLWYLTEFSLRMSNVSENCREN